MTEMTEDRPSYSHDSLEDNPPLRVSPATIPDKLAGRMVKQLAVVNSVLVRAAGSEAVYVAVRALVLASRYLEQNGEEAELAASGWKWSDTEFAGKCVEFQVELVEEAG